VSGRYCLVEGEVQFFPHLPFECDLKYRLGFDPQPIGAPPPAEPFDFEFMIPSEPKTSPLPEVIHIFPSSELLPENLLRFYVCFSHSMQRGRAGAEVSFLDSDGRPVADALYRPPVELWDPTMRRLTVLLDPGRLKRWVGPNVELGPPLRAGQKYALQIGPGLIDLDGRSLRDGLRKEFVVSEPVRKPISVLSWKILPPATDSREALVLLFADPLDWALLHWTITIASADGSVVDGEVAVDQDERQWSFRPNSPWAAGAYKIRAGSSLEDVCGNSFAGAFDRPIRNDPVLDAESDASLVFRLPV
jgi:hypothetical protein